MNRTFPLLGIGIALAVFATLSGCKSADPGRASANASGKPGATDAAKANLLNAPSVKFKNLQGQDVSLDSLKGEVVLVNFWATWCEPCEFEIPWMIEFQQKYSPRGFTVLGVAMDDQGLSVVQPFVDTRRFDVGGKKSAMDYPIVIGNDDIAQKFGGLIGFPTTFLITRDGKIAKRIIGIVNHDELDKHIQALL